MDHKQFLEAVNSISKQKNEGKLKSSFITIIDFLKLKEKKVELLGHKKQLFSTDEDLYYIDYTLKRALLGTAIDNRIIQKRFFLLSFLLLKIFEEHYDLKKVYEFIKEKISLKATLKNSEKNYFSFSFINLSIYLIRNNTDEELSNIVVAELKNILTKIKFAKLYLSSAISSIEIKNEILMNYFFENFKKCQTNYIDVTFIISLYNSIKTSENYSLEKNNLEERLKKMIKPKNILLLFSQIFEEENLKNFQKEFSFFEIFANFYRSVFMKNLKFFLELSEEVQKSVDTYITKKISLKFVIGFMVFCNKLFNKEFNFKKLCEILEDSKNIRYKFVHTILFLIDEKRSKNKLVSQLGKFFEINFCKVLYELKLPEINFNLACGFLENDEIIINPKNNLRVLVLSTAFKEKKCFELAQIILEKKKKSFKEKNWNLYKRTFSNIVQLAHLTKSDNLKKQLYTKVFKIYLNSKKLTSKFDSELEDMSHRKLMGIARNFFYEKISEYFFKEENCLMIETLITEFLKLNQMDKEYQSMINLIKNLLKNKKEKLSKLLSFFLFQNYQAEEKDHQTILFNQSLDDFTIFCENYNSGKNLNSDDLEILVDCLISLLGVFNKDIRELVKNVFEMFIEKYDLKTFELIESELFRLLDEGRIMDDEDSDSEEKDIILDGKLI